MGWFRKVMNYVLGDEPEENARKYDGKISENKAAKRTETKLKEKKQPAVVQPSSRHEGKGGEVQARVSYQYPQGKFRFPLISDEELIEEQRLRKAERQGRRETDHRSQIAFGHEHLQKEKQAAVTKQHVQEESENRYAQRSTPEEKYASSPIKTDPKIEKKEKVRTRPFRPTEVPSPIYGFRQRPSSQFEEQLDEPIEFELPSPIYGFKQQLSSQSEAQLDEPIEFELPSSSLNMLHTLGDSSHTLPVDGKVNVEREAEAPQQKDLIAEQEKKEQTEPVPFTEEKQQVDCTIGMEEPILSLLVERAQSAQVSLEAEEMPSKDSVNQQTSVHSLLEDELLIEEEEKESEPIEQIEEQPIEQMVCSEEDTNKDKQFSDPASSGHFSQEEQRERPRRPVVPFNVMMLKKDRERLEQKALSQRSSEAASNAGNTEASMHHEQTGSSNLKEKSSLKQEVPSSPLLIERKEGVYEFPSMNLLNVPRHEKEDDNQWLEEQRHLLDMTLKNFNVRAKVVNVTQGPTVTRFEVHPEPGVKVNKITNLTDDIKLSLAARDIRIEAPIPGKNTIGIEVPNRESKAVLLQEILSKAAFQDHPSPLSVALGLDISGTPIVIDLKKMPHGLIAGATGSGKSVCINTIIVSLLYKASPHQVKLMLIDPKMVELAPYNGIPHLVSPVITDAKAATAALKWAVEEMERRYELFAHTGVRDITKYNEKVEQHQEKSGELPYLVIIIDELADLMMVSPGEVEEAICRIAQKARACGIHLLLATQRPSVDVITGLIKANVPTRVAFSVSSQVDSRTIIDTAGAEKLLGRGDMLLLENGSSKTVRIQGNFVSDEEIDAVVNHVKGQMKPNYLFEQNDLIQRQQQFSTEEDELFYEACEFVVSQGGASTSSVQRHFRIGYNRAARLIDMMEAQGIISEAKGSKPRDVLITEEELTELQNVSSPF